MSRSKSVARFTRSELLEMSVRELKKLLPAGDQYKPTDNRDLCDYLIESGAVDLVVEEPSLIQSGAVDLGGNLVPSVDQSPSLVQSNSVDQSHLVDQLPSVVSPSLEERDNESIPERQHSSEEAQEGSHLCPATQQTRTSNSGLKTMTETEEQPNDCNTPDTSMDTTVTDDEEDAEDFSALESSPSAADQQTRSFEQRPDPPSQRISTQQPQPVNSVESSAQQEQEDTKEELARLRAEVAKRTEAHAKLEKERDELKGANKRLSCSYHVHKLFCEQRATQTNSELARLHAEEANWTEERTQLEKERDELKETEEELTRLIQEQVETTEELARLRAEEAKWTEERDELIGMVKKLVEALAKLTKERDDLTIERDELEEASKRTTLREGDRAVITNNYKGKQGTTGTVARVTACYATITDDCGNPHTRGHSNMHKISNQQP